MILKERGEYFGDEDEIEFELRELLEQKKEQDTETFHDNFDVN